MTTYRIDPSAAGAGTQVMRYERDATIVLVGCGGTGGFLAEAVCRLLIGRSAQLYLVDPDRVEPHNLARQAFERADTGRFKAEVLAERFARRFSREIGYSVLPYNRELHAQDFGIAESRLNLLIGCVDNAAARRAIAATLDECARSCSSPRPARPAWWLDCGNYAECRVKGQAGSPGRLPARGARHRGAGVGRALRRRRAPRGEIA